MALMILQTEHISIIGTSMLIGMSRGGVEKCSDTYVLYIQCWIPFSHVVLPITSGITSNTN